MKNLKSCEWLAEHLEQVQVLDAGIVKPGVASPYSPAAIIQGAKRFDISGALTQSDAPLPNTMCDGAQFQANMRQLGINQNDTVVVYDDLGLFSAARAWWMFKSMGFTHVYVLDGGLPRWQALGLPTTSSYAINDLIGDFVAKPQSGYFIDSQQVLAAINDDSVCLLDARGAKRFSGEDPEPRQNMRSGHIPNSKNLPYTELLDQNGLLKSVEQLQALFAERGITDQALQFSCGSGVTACILAMAADECGYQKLSVYDGSWSEWGLPSELPVATGN
ncbi:sulfurtransferase [Pseudoalteromonas sp. MMG022]|uniref:sulfurtransferase n=1 Tax=Pseudoalteromonas sp. MMG022 TaxID=2909978 RepID=UPI001F2F1FE5|nr:sulfurtransferase [Pseudoalteromonas sp. MMG022]MCF6435566.1 sulfurtransferase [Pseudoalteromonas sp. MMG022]